MNIFKLVIIPVLIFSCTSKKDLVNNNVDFRKYELAYNSITYGMNKERPLLDEYNCDAAGIKIIPAIYKITNFNIYGTEFFKNTNSYSNSEIIKLSKKYTKSNWRKDVDYRVLMVNELEKFHGPLRYIYFSEIRNDSLRAEILGNPFANYSMTTGDRKSVV